MTEEFSGAAEMLGSEQLPVRLGGIDALWRLAQDSPSHHMLAVVELLCAFVREPPHGPTSDGTGGTIRPDVRAIMALIGAKDATYRRQIKLSFSLNLECAGLSGADLSGARLHGATLSGANFCDADLSGADLSKAFLWDADLEHATLSGADLSCAMLTGANLSGAHLTGADLRGCRPCRR